jgi:hypothetical protein
MKTYYELGHHLSQTEELNAAFKETYGPSCTNNNSPTLNNSESKPLVEFIQKWCLRPKTIWAYLGDEESQPDDLWEAMDSLLLTGQASRVGTVVSSSLYPCVRENYVKTNGEPTAEKDVVSQFMHSISLLK